MKTIYLIRHAKSSWAFNLPDHDRPLARRGRKDVEKVGKYLSETYQKPDLIISSTASRAFYTALYVCDAFKIDESHIQLNSNLYHADPEKILDIVHHVTEEDHHCLALFGHNPGFTYAANLLGNSDIENIPTCGAVGITFEVDKWSEIHFSKGGLLFFHFPKGLHS